MKDKIQAYIQSIEGELFALSDQIFDLAEISCQEVRSCRILEEYLERNGFQVEHNVGGMDHSFRAVYELGEGGPSLKPFQKVCHT